MKTISIQANPANKAILHAVVLPLVILITVSMFDRDFSLLASIGYIVMMFTIFKSRTTNHPDVFKYKAEYRAFVDTLTSVGIVLMLGMLMILVLAL